MVHLQIHDNDTAFLCSYELYIFWYPEPNEYSDLKITTTWTSNDSTYMDYFKPDTECHWYSWTKLKTHPNSWTTDKPKYVGWPMHNRQSVLKHQPTMEHLACGSRRHLVLSIHYLSQSQICSFKCGHSRWNHYRTYWLLSQIYLSSWSSRILRRFDHMGLIHGSTCAWINKK